MERNVRRRIDFAAEEDDMLAAEILTQLPIANPSQDTASVTFSDHEAGKKTLFQPLM